MNALAQHQQKPAWTSGVTRRLGRARQAVADFVARRTLRDQVAAMESRGALDDFLKDIGSTRPEIEKMIRGYGNTQRLLPAMMARLGVDAAAFDAATLYEVRETCAGCRAHRRCRRWLAKASGPATAYRDFCPSAKTFDTTAARSVQQD